MVNVKPVQLGKNTRMSFGKIEEVLKMPNLIEVQKNSYNWFLTEGLREVFKDVSGITDFNNNLVLDFVDYKLDDKPNYSVSECKERDATYAAALRVTARLLNKETGEIKESEVFMGDFPLMTASGTFVINGAERVIVSQLVRSPGVYFKMDYDRSGKELFSSTIIPNRGAWLEYENDVNDVFYVRIDKNRKIPITVFIRCLGLGTDQEILDFFGDDDRMRATIEKDTCKTMEEALFEIYRKLRPSEPPTIESAQAHIHGLFFDPRRYDLSRVGRYKYNKKLRLEGRLVGQVLAQPVANPNTGELMAEAGQTVTKELADQMDDAGVTVAVVTVGDREVKVISNGMVDIQKYVDFDAKAECGINERVCHRVLMEILESRPGRGRAQGGHPGPPGRPDAQPHHRGRHLRLHQLYELPGHGSGHHRRHRPSGKPAHPVCGRAFAEPVPHRLLPPGAGHPGAHDPPGPGPGDPDPPQPHQHPSRGGRHQGVFRFLAP